jgi:hypothetical protein
VTKQADHISPVLYFVLFDRFVLTRQTYYDMPHVQCQYFSLFYYYFTYIIDIVHLFTIWLIVANGFNKIKNGNLILHATLKYKQNSSAYGIAILMA